MMFTYLGFAAFQDTKLEVYCTSVESTLQQLNLALYDCRKGRIIVLSSSDLSCYYGGC
jgi:hypothetical protein